MVGDKIINNYYFFSTGSFPIGNASTNRAISYMRGLVELGCDVTLFLLAPDSKQSPNSNLKNSEYKGVKIKYTCPVLFVRNKFFNKLNYIFGILIGLYHLLNVILKHKSKAPIFLLFIDPILIWIFLAPIKMLGAKVFHERSEYPFIGKERSKMLKFYLTKVIPRFNGVYVISNALVTYFKKFTYNPILLLPMTVELDRFNLVKNNKRGKYIAYCGSMYTDKDGIPDLIEAFNLIANEYPDIQLYLIGDNSDVEKFKIVRHKINESKVKERIICTGHIERNKMPELLCNASMLALCRPANIQAKGGFPTKLGEYLATANPVVITDVGDHTKYLEDRKSAFIALPDNPVDFAAKMNECLINKELAFSVGKAGFQVALEHFNYKKQAVTLKNFVKNTL